MNLPCQIAYISQDIYQAYQSATDYCDGQQAFGITSEGLQAFCDYIGLLATDYIRSWQQITSDYYCSLFIMYSNPTMVLHNIFIQITLRIRYKLAYMHG